MAITKYNDFIPGQDITNMGNNVDLNALNDDKSNITVNFGTTPATVTVKEGSIIEVNGNRYVIDTADETFQMSSTAHEYITFTDNPSTAFGSASTEGTYSADKQGFYQAGNTTRTLKWHVNQTDETIGLLPQFLQGKELFGVTHLSAYIGSNQSISFGSTTQIQIDSELYDILSEFNTATYIFTATYDGWYDIKCSFKCDNNTSANENNRIDIYVRKNVSTTIMSFSGTPEESGVPGEIISVGGSKHVYLQAGDTIGVYAFSPNLNFQITSGEENSYLTISRKF